MSIEYREPEFSKLVVVEKIPPVGKSIHLAPDESERKRIAKRVDVISLDNLTGDIRIKADRSSVTVAGDLSANLQRECVASLEEMSETINDSFEIRFLRNRNMEQAEEIELDEFEILDGEEIDLGEILVQQLSLAMSPFPRKKGVTGLVDQYGAAGDASPFTVLRELVKKDV